MPADQNEPVAALHVAEPVVLLEVPSRALRLQHEEVGRVGEVGTADESLVVIDAELTFRAGQVRAGNRYSDPSRPDTNPDISPNVTEPQRRVSETGAGER